MEDKGFDGLMLMNVRRGLALKKDKGIKELNLNVLRADGFGSERVCFMEVSENKLPDSTILTGTCKIRGQLHTFEHHIPHYGLHNSSIIGFLPIKEKIVASSLDG